MSLSKEASIALYQSISEENKERVMEHWHASSLSACPRAQYFLRSGVKPLNKPTGAKILRWGAGHHMEKAIRPHIEKLYKGVGSNLRMTSEILDLTGEFDNYAADEETLVEIKSVSDYAFFEEGNELGLKEECGTYVNRNGREVKKYRIKQTPYLHHEIQQHCYKILLEELGKQVKKIDYVYISLNGRIVVYKTEPDPKITLNVENRLRALNGAWKTKTPPACICRPDHPLWGPVMQYCDFQNGDKCCELSNVKEKQSEEIQN